MHIALTREDSRRTDAYTIQELGLPGMVLMENAGRAIFEIVMDILEERGGLTAYIVAGKGNNGGDGFVVARYLIEAGVDVVTFHTAKPGEYSGDALSNFKILQALSPRVYHTPDIEALTQYTEGLLAADVIVDALLGTGITGAPREPLDHFIEWINSYNAPTVAADIPSGVDANSGQIPGAAISAEATVTMGSPKTGLLFSPGRDFAGEVTVADIGIPGRALEKVEHFYYLPEEDDIFYRLPVHNSDTYKHRVGKLFTLCGARGFTGAATLVNEAALIAGTGLIFAGVPDSLNSILETKLTEVITVPLPETEAGSFASEGFPELVESLDWSDALAIGSGMTPHESTMSLVEQVISEYRKPVVIDADAATWYSGDRTHLLRESPAQIILTPHWGEFSRIAGYSNDEIARNRLEIAREFAQEYNLTLILKGAPTIIANTAGDVFINTTGNPGMATAGSGDVLTGMLAGFVSQGLSTIDAALVAVYLHGLSGDFAAAELSEFSLTAGSLIDYLPEALTYIQEFYEHI